MTVIGHSSGCTVATALAEQRPDAVAALALIDMGPSPDAKIPERLLFRLLPAPLTGRLLWRLRTKAAIRRAARTGFTRPVDIPDSFIEHVLGMTHQDFVGAMPPIAILRILAEHRVSVVARPGMRLGECRFGAPPLEVARNMAMCDLPSRFVPVRLHGTSRSRHGRVGWRGSPWQGSAIERIPSSMLSWSRTRLSW